MNNRWLEDFVSLAETSNFTRSAKLRHSNQSAFSRRIKSLEDWLGATLFDRSSHPLKLTAAGEAFHPVAVEILRKIQQAKNVVQSEIDKGTRKVCFAATHSVGSGFFPGWLRKLESSHREFEATFVCHGLTGCFEMLDQGKVDFLLCHTHPDSELLLPDDQHISVSLGFDQLIPVSAPDEDNAPLFGPDGKSPDRLNYLAYSPQSSIGRAIARNLSRKKQAVELNPVFTSEFASILKSMTLERYGFSWLPKRDIVSELSTNELVPAADENWNVPVEIRLFRMRDTLSPPASDLWNEFAGTH